MAKTKREKKEMAKKRRPQVDTVLLVVTLLLVVFGLIMMFSASFASALYMFGDGYRYIKKQALFAVAGVVMMMVASYVNVRFLHRWAWVLYGISEVLLLITLFMPKINDARRWIVIGAGDSSFTFQPSELSKIAIIILLAHIISVHPAKMKELKYGFLMPMAALLGVVGIMFFQPHLSGIIIILLIGVAMMFIGGTRLRWFGITTAVGIPAGIAAVFFSGRMDYAMTRIQMWLDPLQDRTGDGHQIYQSLLAIGSGGLMGLGLGNSRQKHLYLPESHNDFIFSIICEELGLIGALFVIALFVIFVARGMKIALNAKNQFSAMLAMGITLHIGLQAFLNIAVASNTVPNTGISLPFFSSGGTSLAILLVEVGLLLSVSRYSATKDKQKEAGT